MLLGARRKLCKYKYSRSIATIYSLNTSIVKDKETTSDALAEVSNLVTSL
jgi:hypothetical protein